jgi:hypothetical protein
MKLAYFVTPHGFGHAARACAVIQAIAERRGDVGFEIFTTVPEWFFGQSLNTAYGYHRLEADLGLVQKGPVEADLPATVACLDQMLPFDPCLVDALAVRLSHLHCRAVVCDIAPLGIAVARQAAIPSILVENFTWDWIYQAYVGNHPGLGPHIDYLRTVFSQADLHIQTDPVCRMRPGALHLGPISRKPRQSRQAVRSALGIQGDTRLITVSMGGVPGPELIPMATRLPDGVAIVLASRDGAGSRLPGVIRLGAEASFYYPDLVQAADAAAGKIGYSTLAELCPAGLPYAFVARADCPEAAVLAAFAQQHLPCLRLEPGALDNGRWLQRIADLLALPRASSTLTNAAGQAAAAVLDHLAAARTAPASGRFVDKQVAAEGKNA